MKPIIEVENLSKQYRLGTVGTGSLHHDINRWWHRVRGKEYPYLRIGETNQRETSGILGNILRLIFMVKEYREKIKDAELIKNIAAEGQAWAFEHYASTPTAKKFLKLL